MKEGREGRRQTEGVKEVVREVEDSSRSKEGRKEGSRGLKLERKG